MAPESASLDDVSEDGIETESDSRTPVYERVPPEEVLEAPSLSLLRGVLACVETVDEIRAYVAYENQHHQRDEVLHLLGKKRDALKWAEL